VKYLKELLDFSTYLNAKKIAVLIPVFLFTDALTSHFLGKPLILFTGKDFHPENFPVGYAFVSLIGFYISMKVLAFVRIFALRLYQRTPIYHWLNKVGDDKNYYIDPDYCLPHQVREYGENHTDAKGSTAQKLYESHEYHTDYRHAVDSLCFMVGSFILFNLVTLHNSSLHILAEKITLLSTGEWFGMYYLAAAILIFYSIRPSGSREFLIYWRDNPINDRSRDIEYGQWGAYPTHSRY